MSDEKQFVFLSEDDSLTHPVSFRKRSCMKSTPDKVILFVDDESDVLSAISRFFRKESYVLMFAQSGERALEILASEPVIIIVSDLRMPEMDGLTLLNKVKVLYPEIIRLILSASSDICQIIEAIDSGDVFRFIQKPVQPETFKQIIQDAEDFYHLQ